jgi:TPR repeat protein
MKTRLRVREIFFAAALIFCFAASAWAASTNYEKGLAAFDGRDYRTAANAWRAGDKAGDPECTNALGMLFADGYGVGRDDDIALELYDKAAKMGNAKGQYNLAMFYIHERGVSAKNQQHRALGYMEDAAEQNYAPAQSFLGVFYEQRGELDRAVPFYQSAAAQGDELSIIRLKALGESVPVKEPEPRRRSGGGRRDRENETPAASLIAEANQNQMRFDRDYKGRVIETEGIVDEITEKRGKYFLKLYGEGRLASPFDYIGCYFAKPHERALLSLDKGDKVKIRGTYDGKQQFQVAALELLDCEIVR